MSKRTIVTHKGQSHRDEFIACCLLIAAGETDRIERRDATDADLNGSHVIVLDQGGKHNPTLHNYDHHQFEQEADPACSITLILPLLGVDVAQAREVWGWLEFSERLDSKGPFATAAHYEGTPEGLFASISPIETTVLRWFAEQKVIVPTEDFGTDNITADTGRLWHLMAMIGQEKLEYIKAVNDRLVLLETSMEVLVIEGLRVADLRCIPADDNPMLGTGLFLKDAEISVKLCHDDRGPGVAIIRHDDDLRFDTRQIAGEDGVHFTHASGFIAKLEADACPLDMIKRSIKVEA